MFCFFEPFVDLNKSLLTEHVIWPSVIIMIVKWGGIRKVKLSLCVRCLIYLFIIIIFLKINIVWYFNLKNRFNWCDLNESDERCFMFFFFLYFQNKIVEYERCEVCKSSDRNLYKAQNVHTVSYCIYTLVVYRN